MDGSSNLDVNGTVTATSFSGNGAGVTNLNAGNLTGTVADARSVESGLYTEAQVKLAAKLNALEEVWVLFP